MRGKAQEYVADPQTHRENGSLSRERFSIMDVPNCGLLSHPLWPERFGILALLVLVSGSRATIIVLLSHLILTSLCQQGKLLRGLVQLSLTGFSKEDWQARRRGESE